MTALTLFVIRHAEKQGEDWPGPGLTEEGEEDPDSLVIRGWQRAGAWAALFSAGHGGSDYLAPTVIFAAKPGKTDKLDQGVSRRPYETIIPLAARLGLVPNADIAKGNEQDLVNAVFGLSGVVLVSWEHKAIVESILPLIPLSSGRPPTDWPGGRFDVVLRFDRSAGATRLAYRPLCPCLMSGDSDHMW
jgi:hypothetical protein